jgi:HEAT repeat protein
MVEASQTYNYSPPVAQLLTYREPGIEKAEDWPDYVQQVGLGSEHIPELIRMATDQSLLEGEEEGEEDDRSWGGPIHAWRALGQLHAEAAIEPLLSLLQTQAHSDWVMEELPDVFGMIGPTALPLLKTFLADDSKDEWARVNASSCLEKIGMYSPEARSACIEILSKQMEAFLAKETFLDDDYEVNSFLVLALTKLQAREAAPLIERAFQADRVDESIMGDWREVQYDLGLLPPEEAAQIRVRRLSQRIAIRSELDAEAPSGKAHGREDVHKAVKRKRKQARQVRKKNRKR